MSKSLRIICLNNIMEVPRDSSWSTMPYDIEHNFKKKVRDKLWSKKQKKSIFILYVKKKLRQIQP